LRTMKGNIMKLTESQLRQIIMEELENILEEGEGGSLKASLKAFATKLRQAMTTFGLLVAVGGMTAVKLKIDKQNVVSMAEKDEKAQELEEQLEELVELQKDLQAKIKENPEEAENLKSEIDKINKQIDELKEMKKKTRYSVGEWNTLIHLTSPKSHSKSNKNEALRRRSISSRNIT